MAAPAAGAPAAPKGEEFHDTVAEAISREVFSTYRCTSSALCAQAQPHPGDIAEPSSLSAIPLPPTTYPLLEAFPPEVLASGQLSQLQLEGILYAATKHLSWLPSGDRCGFFIGDGAGVGKGRQIAGIIVDNYARGRRKAVWVSTSTDLYQDALRDLRDLGCHVPVIQNLQALDKATNTPQEGVLFMTYSTLTSSIKGRSRLQQVVDWLGGAAAFQGALVFDEAHKAKNYSANEKQGTKVARDVVGLQRALPAARVVYCSATGVSEVGHLAYMERLGLWGLGSAFADFAAFLDAMKRRGVTFMELLAMELKEQGFYVARGLNFRDAEFSELECKLTPEQVAMYDAAVELWSDLRSKLAAAQAASGNAKDVWKPFYGGMQRFFKLLCVSLKVPTVVAEARAALDAGHAVVIGLQSTGEAAADALSLEPGAACGFVSPTRELLRHFIERHFPTTHAGVGVAGAEQEPPGAGGGAGEAPLPDGGGRPLPPPSPTASSPGGGAGGEGSATPVAGGGGGGEDATLAQTKEELLEAVEALELPPNFLDELVDKLGGPKGVAEMTGRKGRVVREAPGRRPTFVLRARGEGAAELDSLNIREKAAFQEGKKLVAIVSDAASTGISLHASRAAANRRRRVHLTIELPWSADKAIQQLGRSHRSNQTCAPIYKLVFTDVGGERRFAAAVARRLQSLGALTRGDRRAASGLDLSVLNFDSPLGRKSLRKMYDMLVNESPLLPPGVRIEQVLEGVPEEELAACPRLAQVAAGDASSVSAAEMVGETQALHASLRGSVGIMGIGLELPRGDTVAEASPTAAATSAAAKDQGDVRRFLNRLLCAPVGRQRLLFNYFQATLAAEIRAARAEGTFTEGVSDLPGQSIARAGEPEALWVDPLSGLATLRHDLNVDRGLPYDAAVARLEHERLPGDAHSGFWASRRPQFGRTMYLLALRRKAGEGGGFSFSIARPNTGPSFFDMDLDELRSKYAPCAPADAEEGWRELHAACLDACMHGDGCAQGPACTFGRRLAAVTILSGSVVRIWRELEVVLAKHELELSKGDRTMRIVRVEFGDGSAPLIGVRYPAKLLGEVVTTLQQQRERAAAAAAAGGGAAEAAAPGGRRTEAPTPVDPRALKRAFAAPRTIMSFFQPKPAASSTAAAAPSGSSAAAGGGADASAAPPAKPAGGKLLGQKRSAAGGGSGSSAAAKRRAAGGAGGKGKQHGQLTLLGLSAKPPPTQAAPAAAPQQAGAGDVVDLVGDDGEEEEEVKEGGGPAAGGAAQQRGPSRVAADVLREQPRNGTGAGAGAGAGATAKRPAPPAGRRYEPSAGEVAALAALGFAEREARRALVATLGDLERAANFLLSAT